jgi:hypothetical protein
MLVEVLYITREINENGRERERKNRTLDYGRRNSETG